MALGMLECSLGRTWLNDDGKANETKLWYEELVVAVLGRKMKRSVFVFTGELDRILCGDGLLTGILTRAPASLLRWFFVLNTSIFSLLDGWSLRFFFHGSRFLLPFLFNSSRAAWSWRVFLVEGLREK